MVQYHHANKERQTTINQKNAGISYFRNKYNLPRNYKISLFNHETYLIITDIDAKLLRLYNAMILWLRELDSAKLPNYLEKRLDLPVNYLNNELATILNSPGAGIL